jgi:serine/threonine protein kinase
MTSGQSNSQTKSGQKTKPTKARGPVQQDSKEVMAALVPNLVKRLGGYDPIGVRRAAEGIHERQPRKIAGALQQGRHAARGELMLHPLEAFVVDEGSALVMELVSGETLRGSVPIEMAIDCGRQITRAFEAAHEKSIVHRDLKLSMPEVRSVDDGATALS